MKIAVLSGKGGTGKTLISVNLAAVANESIYIDCDVEEPNGYLFFKPENVISEKIKIKVPVVDENICDGCRTCVDFCKFNALAYIMNKLIIFEEVCHSCGGCVLVCPVEALSEKDKVIGEVQKGSSENVSVITGVMNEGEASGIPIIRKMFDDYLDIEGPITFIDCPPGSACIVMESIKDADYCIMVAEPTIFGAHNLSMVYELVSLFKKPNGVILNKCLEGENPSEKFCMENGVDIIGRIPFDNELGELNSNAFIAARENEKYRHLFSTLLQNIVKEVSSETITNPER